MMLVAIRPEGGWEEPHELDAFKRSGFQRVLLGLRVLRSDVQHQQRRHRLCLRSPQSAPSRETADWR